MVDSIRPAAQPRHATARAQQQPFDEPSFMSKYLQISANRKISSAEVTSLFNTFKKPASPVAVGTPAQKKLTFDFDRLEFANDKTRERYRNFLLEYAGLSV